MPLVVPTAPDPLRGYRPPAPAAPEFNLMAAAQMHMEGRLVNEPGQVEEGNLDLNKRPVVSNADGSKSTVRSITIGEDDNTVVIPTVVGNKVLSNQDAIAHYKRTGEHLGKFDNQKDADEYAERLHKKQAKQYGLEP